MMAGGADEDVVMVHESAPTIAKPIKDKGKGKAIDLDSTSSTANADKNLPWVEKYRPANLDELISHKDIISTIVRFIDENKLPHLLFYGPPGTGKTSTILACARKIYGSNYKSMILELNASDDRGIDVVRDKIKTFASTQKLFSSGFKLIILDEADAMTQTAQNALRRVIEQYTKNVRFCVICNYVGKIIPAVQSRCTRFRFSPLGEEQVHQRLQHVIQNEGVAITEDGQKALLRLCQGDMRRALNILQSCHSAYSVIGEEQVYTCTGSPLPADIDQIVSWLLTVDFTTATSNIRSLQIEKGLSLTDILTELDVHVSTMELPAPVKINIMDKMAEIEYNLSRGASEKLQLGALVGSFKLGVELIEKLSGQPMLTAR